MSQTPTPNVSGQSIVSFGGNASPYFIRFLRVNGKVDTVLDGFEGSVGNVYLVEADLDARVVTWTTTSGNETTTFQIIKNSSILGTFELTEQIGMLTFPDGAVTFKPGDTMQVRHIGGAWPGPCLLTFYM